MNYKPISINNHLPMASVVATSVGLCFGIVFFMAASPSSLYVASAPASTASGVGMAHSTSIQPYTIMDPLPRVRLEATPSKKTNFVMPSEVSTERLQVRSMLPTPPSLALTLLLSIGAFVGGLFASQRVVDRRHNMAMASTSGGKHADITRLVPKHTPAVNRRSMMLNVASEPITVRDEASVTAQERERARVQEIETQLMMPPKVPIPSPIAITDADEARRASSMLQTDGCVHLQGLLGPEECKEIISEVNYRLDLAGQNARLGGAKSRYDLKLPLEGACYLAVQRAMGKGGLAQMLENVATGEAYLAELGVLVSEPGAVRQPIHPDTVSHGGNEQPIYSTFIAVQDVTPAMGPTCLIPGTNNPVDHALACGVDHESQRQLLRERPNIDATLKAGDGLTFDSRTLHAGGFNHPEDGKRRILFYVSVQRAVEGETELPPAPERRTAPSAYSILRDYHNRFQLKDYKRWSVWSF